MGDSPLRAGARRAFRRVAPQRAIWSRALPTEIAYWRRWLETRGEGFPQDYAQRLDPQAPLQEPLLLEQLGGMEVARILDVGAGPATWLGRTHPRTRLEITAVDPLGDAYDELLAEFGVTPPVRTLAVEGERLGDRFGNDAFDFAYARNSLDHSADPLRIIGEMLRVVRPGGRVLLRHFRNEGTTMGYEELHQWNFDVRDGRLVVWNPRRTIDVGAELGVDVEARIDVWSEHADWVAAALCA